MSAIAHLPDRVGKIRSLMDRVSARLFDLPLDKLVATALRAKFDEYKMVDSKGKFDRPLILKLLSRKYFFGICTIVLKSLPTDVVRYIGKFFDFDVSFLPRAKKYIMEKADDCHFIIEKYLKRFRTGGHYYHHDYIPVELPGNVLQHAVFSHIDGNDLLSCDFYKLVLQRERGREKLEYTVEEVDEIAKQANDVWAGTQFMAMRAHQKTAHKEQYTKILTDFTEAIKLSDDFASALKRLEAIPEYIECREIATADWNLAGPYHPDW